ncbi:integrase_H2C2 domain-containing protein [Trichonephila clavipes]|nr:integrase_H2C2 domain-containing protein [Trichonephila clavipes]
MLSRPACHEVNEQCEVCTVAIDVPSRSPKEIRDEQMKDEELVKIISCLEDPDKNVLIMSIGLNERAEGTYTPNSKELLLTGMRKYITDYVKNCPDCIKYKAANQKPSGILQTPVPAQSFETLAIDLFRRLPESKDGKR